jgi:hypothetical protein
MVRVRFAEYTSIRVRVSFSREIHLSLKALELLNVLVENRPRALAD